MWVHGPALAGVVADVHRVPAVRPERVQRRELDRRLVAEPAAHNNRLDAVTVRQHRRRSRVIWSRCTSSSRGRCAASTTRSGARSCGRRATSRSPLPRVHRRRVSMPPATRPDVARSTGSFRPGPVSRLGPRRRLSSRRRHPEQTPQPPASADQRRRRRQQHLRRALPPAGVQVHAGDRGCRAGVFSGSD